MPTSITPHVSSSTKSANIGKGETLYRGPVRHRKLLIGSPANVPVPIAAFQPRNAPRVGIVERYAPSLTKQTKRFNEKVAGAI